MLQSFNIAKPLKMKHCSCTQIVLLYSCGWAWDTVLSQAPVIFTQILRWPFLATSEWTNKHHLSKHTCDPNPETIDLRVAQQNNQVLCARFTRNFVFIECEGAEEKIMGSINCACLECWCKIWYLAPSNYPPSNQHTLSSFHKLFLPIFNNNYVK